MKLMNNLFSLALLAMISLSINNSLVAQEAESVPEVAAELQALVMEVSGLLDAEPVDKEAIAAKLADFDALYEKYEGDTSEDRARVLMMKGLLQMEILENPEGAIAAFRRLEADFAGTDMEQRAKSAVEKIQIQTQLVVGKPFPGFTVSDLAGDPLSLEAFAGKVVLVDFWATWCGPCVAELPNVLETYRTYHDKGFEVIGISLDKSREALETFIKEKGMDWPQHFDGKGWSNDLAGKYGIQSIPATFLLDGKGMIVGKNLRGSELKEAVGKALKAE